MMVNGADISPRAYLGVTNAVIDKVVEWQIKTARPHLSDNLSRLSLCENSPR